MNSPERTPNLEVHISQGEPTPTGKAFLALCEIYRIRHPESHGVPLPLQDQYWLSAAKVIKDHILQNLQNLLYDEMEKRDKNKQSS